MDRRKLENGKPGWRFSSSFLYVLTLAWNLLLVLDLIRIDPLPFIDEIVLVVGGYFLNRTAIRRFQFDRRLTEQSTGKLSD